MTKRSLHLPDPAAAGKGTDANMTTEQQVAKPTGGVAGKPSASANPTGGVAGKPSASANPTGAAVGKPSTSANPTGAVAGKPSTSANPTGAVAGKPSTSANPTGAVAGKPNTRSEAAKRPRVKKQVQALGRNRSSPARLVKLNALLSDNQKDLIIKGEWGGMLQVTATVMPVDLSMWVLACFDPIRRELVIPGRGTIRVDADSYQRNFGLRNEGSRVPFELDGEAISFMNEEYAIENAMAPTFTDWCEMIRGMGGVADMKFLRAYFAAVISCFMCPTMKCTITPRCYGAIKNMEQARGSNFSQLAIDQIVTEVKGMGSKKNSACCCLYHLVILYLDSLEVDEPVPAPSDCPIRAAAWTNKLIHVVIQKDRKQNGGFGKLKLKEAVGATIRDGLFVGMAQTEDFVASKLPAAISNEKKRKLTQLVGDLCTDISRRLGTFVEEYGRLNEDEPSTTNLDNTRNKRQKVNIDEEADEFED